MEDWQADEEQQRDDGYEHAPGMSHDRRCHAVPESAPGVGPFGMEECNAQRVHAWAQDSQERRQRREPVEHGEPHDHRPRPPHGPEVAQAQQDHAEETNGNSEPGEKNRAAGSGDRVCECFRGRALADLLAEAAHDEQRVVDGDTEADHAYDVGCVDRNRDDTREQECAGHRARDGEPAHHERQKGGDHGAENEQEQCGHQR